MRTTSDDSPRRGTARSACGLALVLALAHGTTGCAHQLTNEEFAAGAVGVALVVATVVVSGPWSDCARSLSCGEFYPTPEELANPSRPAAFGSHVPPVLSVGAHARARR
ncbi:MAG TPA: hypothetical protein VHW23_33440 [Kofleriaceae bacterium]|nr:hypothetical protein [Kofleriaceae bacterium]